MDKQEQLKKVKTKIDDLVFKEMQKISTRTEQVTVQDDTAYLYSMYFLDEDDPSKKIGEIDLKTMKLLSRTVIEQPNEEFSTIAFGVLPKK